MEEDRPMFEIRHKTLHEQFMDTVAVWPDRPALIDGGGALSYREVAGLSEDLAQVLSSLLRAGERIIALRMSRSRFAPVGIIGILRAGCGYLPVDPDYPRTRQELVLNDAGARLVVTDGPLGADERCVANVGRFVVAERGHSVPRETVQDLAYVIYTSGSTGRPKGCLVGHENVLALFKGCADLFEFGPDDVWTIFHSFSFDFSVWELWGPLLTGGSAVVVPRQAAVDQESLIALLTDHDVSVLSQTPSSFGFLVRALRGGDGPPPLDALRYVVFGGEALRPDDVVSWSELKCAPAAELINMYGITETTVHVTYCRLDEEMCRNARAGRTPIGKPLPHLSVSLRDEQEAPVPDGEPGEMWVAGGGVTHGYLGRADLTAERFVTDGLDGADRVYYRSGDWAVRDERGDLHFIGRRDAQVKLRGFRLELGEVEAVITALSGVRAVACDVRRTRTGTMSSSRMWSSNPVTK
jgi:amino acid adenylation domain-containing protein